MKKYVYVSVFTLLFLLSLSFIVKKNNIREISKLGMENIEALSRGEIIIEIPCMLIYSMPHCQYHSDEGIMRYGVPYQ